MASVSVLMSSALSRSRLSSHRAFQHRAATTVADVAPPTEMAMAGCPTSAHVDIAATSQRHAAAIVTIVDTSVTGLNRRTLIPCTLLPHPWVINVSSQKFNKFLTSSINYS
jgi:hypothetical protein